MREFEHTLIDNLEPVNCSNSSSGEANFTMGEAQIREIFCEKVYLEIIESRIFRRLNSIRFLGAIDYVLFPDEPEKQHTRYQHSLGVARLALEYAKNKIEEPELRFPIVIAALLHDIGHAPLSHSLEPLFQDHFQIGHHLVGKQIIRGELERRGEIWNILERNSINPLEVQAIIDGYGSSIFSKNIFRHSINIDTIEGILRCFSYFDSKPPKTSPEAVLQAIEILPSSSSEERLSGSEQEFVTKILDYFWSAKNYVYKNLVNSHLGILSDYVAKWYMHNHQNSNSLDSKKFQKQTFYYSENQFRKVNPKLFGELKRIRNEKYLQLFFNTHIDQYVCREFFIADVDLVSINSIDRRYKQEKLVIKNPKFKGNLSNAVHIPKYKESYRLFE